MSSGEGPASAAAYALCGKLASGRDFRAKACSFGTARRADRSSRSLAGLKVTTRMSCNLRCQRCWDSLPERDIIFGSLPLLTHQQRRVDKCGALQTWHGSASCDCWSGSAVALSSIRGLDGTRSPGATAGITICQALPFAYSLPPAQHNLSDSVQ